MLCCAKVHIKAEPPGVCVNYHRNWKNWCVRGGGGDGGGGGGWGYSLFLLSPARPQEFARRYRKLAPRLYESLGTSPEHASRGKLFGKYDKPLARGFLEPPLDPAARVKPALMLKGCCANTLVLFQSGEAPLNEQRGRADRKTLTNGKKTLGRQTKVVLVLGSDLSRQREWKDASSKALWRRFYFEPTCKFRVSTSKNAG